MNQDQMPAPQQDRLTPTDVLETALGAYSESYTHPTTRREQLGQWIATGIHLVAANVFGAAALYVADTVTSGQIKAAEILGHQVDPKVTVGLGLGVAAVYAGVNVYHSVRASVHAGRALEPLPQPEAHVQQL